MKENNMIDVNILLKFAATPGLCSNEELENIKQFLEEYLVYRNMYRDGFDIDPKGQTIEVHLDRVTWYMKREK